MAFTETFEDDLAVSVGNPTKASEFNDLSNNTDALKERFIVNAYFNNSGVTNEDGFFRGDFSDPTWLMAKNTGNSTIKYCGIWIEVNNDQPSVRCVLQSTTAAPASATAGHLLAPSIRAVGGVTGGDEGFTDTSLL